MPPWQPRHPPWVEGHRCPSAPQAAGLLLPLGDEGGLCLGQQDAPGSSVCKTPRHVLEPLPAPARFECSEKPRPQRCQSQTQGGQAPSRLAHALFWHSPTMPQLPALPARAVLVPSAQAHSSLLSQPSSPTDATWSCPGVQCALLCHLVLQASACPRCPARAPLPLHAGVGVGTCRPGQHVPRQRKHTPSPAFLPPSRAVSALATPGSPTAAQGPALALPELGVAWHSTRDPARPRDGAQGMAGPSSRPGWGRM